MVSIPLVYSLLVRLRRPPRLAPLIVLASSALLLCSALASPGPDEFPLSNDRNVDQRVFELSTKVNLVHLLPDGLQGDIVREVLEEHPEIAAQFSGFTLFSNHVGQFQGTGPSVPTLLNGRIFDLSKGYDENRLVNQLNELSYPRRLSDAGYRLDFVTPLGIYCPERAESCAVRPLIDPASRGYFQSHLQRLAFSLRMAADLTLFRHSPMLLKERVYENGIWLFSDRRAGAESRIPDPILRNWIEHMHVADAVPRYKWYHFIGTHPPPRWSAECEFREGLERSRENYKGQTLCVLRGIASWLQKLKDLGVYDRTAIVVSGDHGCSVPVNDLTGKATYSTFLRHTFFGTARPAFLVKPLHSGRPLRYSDRETALVDVAPTALDLVGLGGEFEGGSALGGETGSRRKRTFQRYVAAEFWTGQPVPFAEFQVDGDARDPSSWQLTGIHNVGPAPSRYDSLSDPEVSRFTRGLGLSRDRPQRGYARVFGPEFAFLVSPPAESFHSLRFELRLPRSLDTQSVSLSVNGRPLVREHSFSGQQGKWILLDLPVSPEALQKGNNFVRVEFGEQVRLPSSHWTVSATIRSIRFR